MIGRFLLGAGLGGLVGTGVLALVSLSTPLPDRRLPAVSTPVDATAADASAAVPESNVPATEPGTENTTGAPGVDPSGGAKAPEPAVEPETAVESGGAAKDAADLSGTAATAPVEDVPEIAVAGETEPAADVKTPASDEPGALSPVLPASQPAELATAPDTGAGASPDAPAAEDVIAGGPVSAAGRPAEPVMPLGAAPEAPPEAAAPAPAPPADDFVLLPPGTPLIVPPETGAEALPAGTEGAEVQEPAAPVVSKGTAAGDGAPVETRRLPRIGDGSAVAPSPEDTPQEAENLPPMQRYARPFDNLAGKPVFAVILIDDGAAGLDRQALAALPFPVSFALDPQAEGVGEHAAIYRAAGQEVIMLAAGLPKGGKAQDVEVAFGIMGENLPEAVAVMDLPERRFQNDRSLSALVVPAVAAQGRGLVTWNEGVNAADQVARRADLPSATAFRNLDGAGEAAPVIRRYLDRAAFKAAQENKVIVVGHTRPETVAALLEWTVEGRAATVALAPVTALLSID